MLSILFSLSLLFLVFQLFNLVNSFSLLRSGGPSLANSRFLFESVERTCLATTRVPLTSHIFARKYSEDYFQLGLQFLTRNMQRLTIRGVFYFYWDSFLNVCTLLFFQELIRIASAGQFAPRVYPKKLVFSEVVSFLILLPIHFVVELFRCLSMLVQLVAKIMWILVKGLVVWLSGVFSIALGIFFGVAIIAAVLQIVWRTYVI